MNQQTTWRKEIEQAMGYRKETLADVEGCTLNNQEMDASFDRGYGGAEGAPFTLWTKNHVYFPVVYDGSEWADSVPRNPNGEATQHKGSE